MAKDLRSFIADMKAKRPDDYIEIDKQIDPKFEITAIQEHLEKDLYLSLQASQIHLLLRRNTIALDRFLNCLIMCPGIQFLIRYIRQHRIVLFCKRCCKVPRDHHIDIVLF